MISIHNLGKAYNQQIVLDIESIIIHKGEIIGLVGNNGAGKTTLFRLILDLIKANKGEVLSKNQLVSRTEEWKNYTASYLDESFLLDFLTPEEYFYFIGKTYNFSKIQINQKLEEFKQFLNGEILDQRKKYIRDFSRGNKQKIGIVGALLTEPEILLLDEPFNSLDPSSQIVLKKLIVDYNQRTGATILISSHDLNHVTEICQRIVLLEKGKVIRDMYNNKSALEELEEYFSVEQLN